MPTPRRVAIVAFALLVTAHPLSAGTSTGRLFDTWLGYDVGTWATGRNNVSVAVGDIDGDLDLDFVSSRDDFAAFNFAVVRNNGDGTYGRAVLVSAISESGDITLGDVDGDGDLDVVLANAGRNGAGTTVSIYRNDGQGNFASGQAFAAGPNPTALAAADFDHDGDLDVAVTNHGFFAEGTTVTLLKNDGAGSFGTSVTLAVGDAPRKIVAADLNADGWADLAVANDRHNSIRNRVTILMNDASGSFSPAVAYDAGLPQGYAADGAACLAAGDLDNDGDLDVVYSSRKIYEDGILPVGGYQVFSNNGDGTYAPSQYKRFAVPYSQGVEDLEIADLDGNGWLDIVGAQFSDTAESAFYVVRRGGAADYPPATAYPAGEGVRDLALADANGDGRPDVFSNDYYSYEVTVHQNLGPGTFPAARRSETTTMDRWMDAGDIDGDGDLDVVTAGGYGTSGGLSVLRNNGLGTFSPPQRFSEPYYPGGIKLRDLDGNGSLDLLWGDFNAPNGVPLHVHYRLNDGAGNFGPSATVSMSMADINDVNAIDLNHDGRLDIVASDSLRDEVKIALNMGNAAFASPAAFAGPSGPTQMVFGDFDADGHLDLATANRGFQNDPQPSLSVLIGNGDGTFQPEVRYVTSAIAESTQMTAVDVDADGDVDLLVSNYSGHDVSFFANRGDGTFEPHVRYGVDTDISDFRYADFDGDGVADIAAVCALAMPGLRVAISVVKGIAPLGPAADTGGATAVDGTSAVLHGTVTPNGNATVAFFQYGTTTAYGLRTASQSVGSGTTPVPVSAQVGGLTCGTTYHYRVGAAFARGPNANRSFVTGVDATFTTASCVTAPVPAQRLRTGKPRADANSTPRARVRRPRS
jgi:hypothetical protein